jgi:hypothetical protein
LSDSIRDAFLGLPSGDLIIANHTSYVDVLYLSYKYAPVFATVVKNEKDDGFSVVRQSFISALFCDIFNGLLDNAKKEKLVDVIKYARDYHLGPVVIFPEGTTSNGFSTLKFQGSLFENLSKENTRLHFIALKYEYVEFNPAFHLDNFWAHLYQLATQMYNSLQVKKIQLTESERKEITANPDPNTLRIYVSAGMGARHQLVSSTYNDKETFMKYWRETQVKDYASKSE